MQNNSKFPFQGRRTFLDKSFAEIFFSSVIVACVTILNFFGEPSAQAQTPKIKAGTLICKSKGGVGLIIGSKENLNCSYSPVNGGPVTQYKGTITRFGLDVGIKGQSEIIWDVLGSTTSVRADMLSGNYVGVAADVALGVGGGAQILLGGTDKSIVLQPLSLKGQTGLNIAAGVAGLDLRKK